MYVLFFFQAEDGIRDIGVTGVQTCALPILVELLFERVAGLDVGKATVTVCVRTPGPNGRRVSEVRTFPTMTRSLGVLRDWLVERGVTVAAIESTSTYWKAPFYCLEEVLAVWLLNARSEERRVGKGCRVR